MQVYLKQSIQCSRWFWILSLEEFSPLKRVFRRECAHVCAQTASAHACVAHRMAHTHMPGTYDGCTHKHSMHSACTHMRDKHGVHIHTCCIHPRRCTHAWHTRYAYTRAWNTRRMYTAVMQLQAARISYCMHKRFCMHKMFCMHKNSTALRQDASEKKKQSKSTEELHRLATFGETQVCQQHWDNT